MTRWHPLAAVLLAALLLLATGALGGCSNSLEARCRRGDGAACGVLADQERHAPNSEAHLPRICDLFRRACAGGNDVGCSNLGAMLAQGQCPGGPTEAVDVLQRACDHGDVAGCNNLGMALRDGAAGAPVDRARAATLFRKACERAPVACDNLGALLLDSDPAGATAAFKAGCALPGDGAEACCFKLGLAHENGWGIPVDKARAAALYTRACDHAVSRACHTLGLLELAATEPDAKSRAAARFRQACDAGEAGSCNNLGLMFAEGIGVPRDAARAVPLLQKACDGGELRACANVGSRYLLGDGVVSDPARGRGLIARACQGGVAEACVPPRTDGAR